MLIKSKTNLSIAIILSLATFAIINNVWSYDALDTIPILSSSNLIDQNKGKTYHFVGRVASIKHTDKLDFINLTNNDIKAISSTIWPSIGFYDGINKGDSVRITGTLGQYKQKWQVNPLSAEHIQLIDSEIKYDKISLSEAIIQIGETFTIGPIRAEYAKIFIARSSGKKHLKIFIHDGEVYTQGIIYEGLWNDSTLEYFNNKELLDIDAEVTEYNGEVSLKVSNVYVINQGIDIHPLDSISINLSEAINKIGDSFIIGPVYPVSAEPFEASSGKTHLRFKVKENTLTVSGIMWESNWDKRTLDLFNKSNPIFIKSKVGTYKNNISLEADLVFKK